MKYTAYWSNGLLQICEDLGTGYVTLIDKVNLNDVNFIKRTIKDGLSGSIFLWKGKKVKIINE